MNGPSISIGAPISSPVHSTNVRAAGGPNSGVQAELSIASSGGSIVIGFNNTLANAAVVASTDGGFTFGPITVPPGPTNSVPCCDPGVVADLLGRFYFTEIYRNDGSGNCTNSVHLSTDGGVTWGGIVGSPFSFGPGTDFPDQPHPGIDRLNLVNGQPQLYVFGRHFTSGINCPQTGGRGTLHGAVVCSTDGGATWSSEIALSPFTDTAHFGIASDGSVYLVGNGNGTMMGTTSILVRRSTSSCQGGLSFGSPVTVADNLTFGTVGLDREGPQPYVVADKKNSNIAYVAWSSDRLTNDGDRDIFLARCTFSGTSGSCEAPIRINDNRIGDGTGQFFPMLCIDPNNQIDISWYDQRAGNFSTAIFHAEVSTTSATLGVSPSFLTSEVNFVPQAFNVTPSYGDYMENNDACDANHFYVPWVSQVSPPEITPASNDPDVFFAVVNNLPQERVSGPLNFTVCPGGSQTNQLEVLNVGDAPLTVNSVSVVSGSADITVGANPTTPVIVQSGAHVDFSVTCTPTSFGSRTATIEVTSNDPNKPVLDLTATCNTPAPPSIRVTGSGAFGNVCAGGGAQQAFTVSNVGMCNLHVSSAATSCPDFTVVNNPFPATVSPDSGVNDVVQFTPTSGGSKNCNLVILSDDPSNPTVTVPLNGNTPSPQINIPPDLGFPPTVIQSVGACKTPEPFPISNIGQCNLNINSVALGGTNGTDYGFSGMPSLPTPLQPGHILGEGNMNTVFAPLGLDRNRDGTLTVTYESDPITHATAAVTRNVCGEGVKTGARLLVTAGGVPLATVKKTQLVRLTTGQTVDVQQDLPLQSVTPTIAACSPFMFHREWGTVSNPIQLVTGSYRLTVMAVINGKTQSQEVSFDVNTCDFNPNIVVNF